MMALSIILKSDDKKRTNIKATAIIGKTLFTKLYGGREVKEKAEVGLND